MPQKAKKKPKNSGNKKGKTRGVFGQGAKVGIYTRVSTHDQKTLPLQLRSLKRYAKQRDWSVLRTLCIDGPRLPGRISGPQRAHPHSGVRSGSGDIGWFFPSALPGQQGVKGAVVTEFNVCFIIDRGEIGAAKYCYV